MWPWRRRQTAAPVARDDAWDPFAAVPLVADGAEVREDSQGLFQVRKIAVPKRGVASLLAQRFGLQRQVRVNLDAYGTLFWRQIDGLRSLREIEMLVREKTQQSQAENEKATILFTKTLMVRHLIYLKMPKRRDRSA